jgi:dimethylaniline monooxygenase (N-oxide forming)
VTSEGKSVVVVGAGIAGLVTAKVLREDGFEVTVFEKEPTIGGVWAVSRTYPGLRTNNSRRTYAFSDHPYDHSADLFPNAEQVREYLASYVRRFRLAPLIQLSTEVILVSRHGRGFEVVVNGPRGEMTLQSDFVVVCAGTFSEPAVPHIRDAERFAGTAVHSSQATDPGLVIGKRVVVVGAGKSALDCATWAAESAQHCTLIFRAAHWMAPRVLPGGIPIDRLVLGRLPEALFRYHRLTRVDRFFHGPGKAVTRLVWRFTGLLLRLNMGMPAIMVPEQPLPRGVENFGVAPEFYDAARHGRLDLRRDEITAFSDGDAVMLASGERVGADVVIFATGWRPTLPFLDPDLASAALSDGHFRLYRHIVAPTEQHLGFVGYASSTACQLTSEISAHWLSQLFRGTLTLPPVKDMEAEIQRVQAWLSDAFPGRRQGYFVGPCVTHYIDDLMADMGVPTRRTRNALTEYLAPFSPSRYRDLSSRHHPVDVFDTEVDSRSARHTARP